MGCEVLRTLVFSGLPSLMTASTTSCLECCNRIVDVGSMFGKDILESLDVGFQRRRWRLKRECIEALKKLYAELVATRFCVRPAYMHEVRHIEPRTALLVGGVSEAAIS